MDSLELQWLICNSHLVWENSLVPGKITTWILWCVVQIQHSCYCSCLHCSTGLFKHYLKSCGLFNLLRTSQSLLGKYLVSCVWSLRFELLPLSLCTEPVTVMDLEMILLPLLPSPSSLTNYESKNCLSKIILSLMHRCFIFHLNLQNTALSVHAKNALLLLWGTQVEKFSVLFYNACYSFHNFPLHSLSFSKGTLSNISNFL